MTSVTFSRSPPVVTVGTIRKGEVWAIQIQGNMAKPALKILYSEGNEQVLSAQAATIEKAGHSVAKALGRKAAEAALKQGKFDLVILGPTLTKNDRHHLPYMAKKASKETRVLVMHSDGGRHHEVDICLETGQGVEQALNKIGSSFGTSAAARGAAAGSR